MKLKYLLAMAPLFLAGCSASVPANTDTQETGDAVMEQTVPAGSGAQVGADDVPVAAEKKVAGTEGQSFDMDADNFSFSVKEIRVKKGEKVVLNVTNKEGFHDLLIDEYEVNTGMIPAGTSKTVEFVASETGKFEYYCSVGNHRAQGMVGTLIVE